MSKAIRLSETGGPEVLRWEEVPVGTPGPGQVRLRHRYVGVNFIDVYHRSGLYPQPLPLVPGSEGAGVITEVGPGVSELRVGDRVAYAGGAPGAYSEERIYPAERLVPLPEGIDERTAAALMLKGMTAQYLLHQTIQVQAGDPILVHAAAGGVGSLLAQWGRHLGARVIGTAGNPDKAELARRHGCAEVIVLEGQSFAARVKELTGGEGVRVVYDSVGKDTFLGSLDCLRRRGMLVSFGQSSGAVPPFDPLLLSNKGSLYLTRPSLFAYVATRAELLATAAALFQAVERGVVKIDPPRVLPLARAADAHRALEARQTTGSTVLEV